MPSCEYCFRHNIEPHNNHTLIHCRVIAPQVENHHQYNMGQALSINIPSYSVNVLRTPLLKRLAKHLGTTMSQTIPQLRSYCLRYYEEKHRTFLLAHLETITQSEQQQPQQSQQMEQPRPQNASMVHRVLRNIGYYPNQQGGAAPETNRPVVQPTFAQRRQHLREEIAGETPLFTELGLYRPTYIQEYVQQTVQAHRMNAPHTRQAFNDFIQTQQPIQPRVALKLKEPVLENMDDIKNVVTEVPETTTCCICMEVDTYITTNCQHAFCNCILHHLSKNGVSCPMCRQSIHELIYDDADHLDTTKKLLPMMPTAVQTLFSSSTAPFTI